MIMVILGIAWLIASVFVAVCTGAILWQGGFLAILIFAGILDFAWWLAKKDWGIGKHFAPATPAASYKSVPLGQPATHRQTTAIGADAAAINTAIANLVASAPGLPNTLDELTALDAPSWGIDPEAMP